MHVRRIIERLTARRRTYTVFGRPPQHVAGERDPDVRSYDEHSPPDADLVRMLHRHMGWLGGRRMLWYLRHGVAVLVAATSDKDLIAYGWLLKWQLVEREFWWLADDGVCMGPFWTNPLYRRRGWYRRLLLHSLAELRERFARPPYIWARSDNTASIRVIESVGFRPLGRHRVETYLNGLFRRHYALDRRQAVEWRSPLPQSRRPV
ncbi:MAG: GNAT family N-acetyltransferase [Phycisphaerae bacterium]